MCIICYKPKGVALPPRQILENCFENNPDGAGFMVKTENGVKINKGYFNFTELYEVLTVQDLTPFDVGIHCRITTHGATCKKNCHPFVIASKLKTIRKTNTIADAAVMHNGVINAVDVPVTSNLSDTVIFTRDVLANIRAIHGGAITESRRACEIVDSLIGASKLLIMDGGGVKMFGNFMSEGGVYYSNDSYKDWNTLYTPQNSLNTFNIFTENDAYLDDYNPSSVLKYKACEACPYYFDCLEQGEYCLNNDEAELVANGYNEKGVLYGI